MSTATTNSTDTPAALPYCETAIPAPVLEKLQAGAFRQLCLHLQERSDEVQNMDLMSLAGFCRNCLAKWMVVEARHMTTKNDTESSSLDELTIQALNALGYEEAAEHVYGMTYGNWKKRHQKKATDAQMEQYKASASLHAKHDKQLLATRAEKPSIPSTKKNETTATTNTPLSNVCCQPMEEIESNVVGVPVSLSSSSPSTNHHQPATKKSRTLPPYSPPPLPQKKTAKDLTVAILTVSDRASKGQYATGDLSGPAVQSTIESIMKQENSTNNTTTQQQQQESSSIQVAQFITAVVPDDVDAIERQLRTWCSDDDNAQSSLSSSPDIILTTGGTGFSPRDVTPEATRRVLLTETPGLMQFCLAESAKVQPLATLSRATCGIGRNGRTLVANLPGNPRAMEEILPLVWPLLLHAQQHVASV